MTGQQSEAQSGCPLAWTYTKCQVHKLFHNSGFVVTSIQKAHIFPYFVDEYVQRRSVKHWYHRMLPAPVFAWLERRFEWQLLIRAIPRSTT